MKTSTQFTVTIWAIVLTYVAILAAFVFGVFIVGGTGWAMIAGAIAVALTILPLIASVAILIDSRQDAQDREYFREIRARKQ